MGSPNDTSIFLSYATALATFSAAAVALGLLHCLNRRQRLWSAIILALAMLGIASSLIVVAKGQPASQLLTILIALAFVATAGYVLHSALSLIFMHPHANSRAEYGYRLWVHREGGVARRSRAITLGLFAAALVTLFLAATPSLFENLLSPPPRYAVYGTCLEGGCGLKQRSGPGPAYPEVDPTDRLLDGNTVRVVCQVRGKPPKGFDSRIWDRLPNGLYVSDAFVDTPNRKGGFSEGVHRCGPRRAVASG